jgi:acyl carrier protein
VTLPAPLATRLDALLAAHARGPTVDREATWQDIGIDSLGLVSFVVACEDELGVAVPDRLLARLRGPAELRAWLDERFADPAGAASAAGPAGVAAG